MDIDLARTFLAIAKGGSFLEAADRLHVTQTAVTARIKNLEGLLGCRLFVRNRSGARLTENGQHFVNLAQQLVQTWELAQRDLPLPKTSAAIITVGCETVLWKSLFVGWISSVAKLVPNLAIRAEVGECEKLHNRLSMGLVDAILVHQPEYFSGIQVEHLIEEKLVLAAVKSNPEPYIYVDWGEPFRSLHDAALPQYSRSQITVNLGPMALRYILENGGKGYFRTRVIRRYLDDGILVRVKGAPEFSYPVYLMYRLNNLNESLNNAMEILRSAVRDVDNW